ncbi:hypothetical protein CEXT_274201 [Caerostris extrusa]|uniref:Uncharacterized protein n=1 Tax=Caerostris extrusa TaxID=172846 RepID=A0AAV4N8I4_CAEEX|nr:hypothetical protein CEXT_274201 [Caerostris extrusa]
MSSLSKSIYTCVIPTKSVVDSSLRVHYTPKWLHSCQFVAEVLRFESAAVFVAECISSSHAQIGYRVNAFRGIFPHISSILQLSAAEQQQCYEELFLLLLQKKSCGEQSNTSAELNNDSEDSLNLLKVTPDKSSSKQKTLDSWIVKNKVPPSTKNINSKLPDEVPSISQNSDSSRTPVSSKKCTEEENLYDEINKRQLMVRIERNVYPEIYKLDKNVTKSISSALTTDSTTSKGSVISIGGMTIEKNPELHTLVEEQKKMSSIKQIQSPEKRDFCSLEDSNSPKQKERKKQCLENVKCHLERNVYISEKPEQKKLEDSNIQIESPKRSYNLRIRKILFP